MSRFWPSLAWLRLFVLRYVQINSLARSTGVIFLTQYAASTISSYLPVSPKNLEIIPHGINDAFRAVHPKFFSKGALTKVVYVSNVSEYKHQWHLVEAIHRLRMDGYELKLELIGGGKGRAQRRLENILKRFDPNGDFVRVFDFLPHEELLKVVATADIFVFASSCENLPITLLEGMALGLPIVCSDRGPMKEVLGNGGQYFDPEDIEAICRGLRSVLDTDQREKQLIAHERSKTFTWSDCSFRTFSYLRKVLATL